MNDTIQIYIIFSNNSAVLVLPQFMYTGLALLNELAKPLGVAAEASPVPAAGAAF